MKTSSFKQIAGFSLLELLLVMSVIAVLLIGVTRYYEATSTAQKENEAILQVQSLKAAVERYGLGKTVGEDNIIDELIARNLLPEKSKNNPWGGAVTVTGNGTGKVTIKFSGIPGGSCKNLAYIFNPDTTNTEFDPSTLCGNTNASTTDLTYTY